MAVDYDAKRQEWPPGTPAAEFEAWLAANPIKMPDHGRHRLRQRPIGKPLAPQAARRRLFAVAMALVVAVVGITWLLTLINRAHVIP